MHPYDFERGKVYQNDDGLIVIKDRCDNYYLLYHNGPFKVEPESLLGYYWEEMVVPKFQEVDDESN